MAPATAAPRGPRARTYAGRRPMHAVKPTLPVDIYVAVAIIVFCIAMSAFFAASETALTGASRARHARTGAQRRQARGAGQPVAAPARTPDRHDAARQHAGQHRLLGLHDQRAAGGDRRAGGGLGHRHHDGAAAGVRRGAAQDGGHQQRRRGVAAVRPHPRADRGDLRPGAARHRGAGSLHAAAVRHQDRRARLHPVGRRRAEERRRPAAPRGQRRALGPRHVRRPARTRRPHRLRHDGATAPP